MSGKDHDDGFRDGSLGKGPDWQRLALGANSLNDYEKGYIDSGRARQGPAHPVPAAPLDGTADEEER